MNFLTISTLMVALANVLTWLENRFFAALHFLGDVSKALISIFPNVLSWLGNRFFAVLHWLGGISKALIETVDILLNGFNDYQTIIFMYSLIWLSIVFIVWFLFE
ncbi:MAG: hypothetical protein WBA39_28700, partial [Rivularia sp. (in: cyanobacteria)]